MADEERVAVSAASLREIHIGVSKATGRLQVSVPQGTKLVDALKVISKIDANALARLPRGCPACLSGEPFDIRERFDPVIKVRF